MGYGPTGMAVLYEAMNQSIFGPVAFNCAAPDDGNMYILNKVGISSNKKRNGYSQLLTVTCGLPLP